MHQKNIQYAGLPLAEAKRALILLHGRGGTASDILSLSPLLHVQNFALLAPQATQQTWYPYSFLAPPADNEPWLSSALSLIGSVVEDITAAGIAAENIYFTGFSQGACLTLEFITRHAQRWGGVAAFTGGLIGDKLYHENYHGDFGGTPVFIGTSDPDPHVPVTRVQASEALLRERNAQVTVKVYPNMGHTISRDELEQANTLIFKA
ncbi:dienelactone hydrolase family protein [Fulvivirgaceae bacterium PWU5]|uniref:Dienelactone hydrolase family protein n=1 Tax=Dawidia cretensis TaxID=2782350 RepID=A0AAP2DVT7_9BACT|nr:dienelactone hydrolase family protein [Dawidia cretensis]MBT1708201.1 dienelactone hydrolase family protein [Dawidia cretensis]